MTAGWRDGGVLKFGLSLQYQCLLCPLVTDAPAQHAFGVLWGKKQTLTVLR